MFGEGTTGATKRRELAGVFASPGHFGLEAISVDYDGIFSLAMSTGLTFYDASYLWLARDFGAELVTLDRQLERMATGLSR